MGGAVTHLGPATEVALTDADPLPTTLSLEKAKQGSCNPALTAARYHSTVSGARGRRLHDDFEAVEGKNVLGKGSFVEVIAVQGRLNHREYALKSFIKPQLSPEEQGLLTNELQIYLGLDHPHIARLEGVYDTDEEVHLVMECCEGGELYERLNTRRVYEETQAARATREILRALGYLHAQGVAHRDLKLENLMYESDCPDSPLKLVDFGLAWAWDPLVPTMRRCCGSPEYVAPEVLGPDGYTGQCDLWSLGVITFMLLVGYAPFPPGDRQLDRVKCGEIDWGSKGRWSSLSAEALDFVRRLLVLDPLERLTAQQAVFHPWLLRTLGNPVQIPAFNPKVLHNLQQYAAAPRVRRVFLQLLAQHLPPEDTSALRTAFLGLDIGNEGVIRVRDLRKTLCGEREPSAELDELFRAIDALGDDAGVYYSEFLAATTEVVSMDAARAVFNRLDTGGKGAIDAEDLEAAFGPLVLNSVDGGIAELLRQADFDTSPGRVGFDGFLRWLANGGGEGEEEAGSNLAAFPRPPAGGFLLAAKAALLGDASAAVRAA